MRTDDAVHLDQALRVPRGFEPLHASLPFARWLMGIPGAVVKIPVLPVRDAGHHDPFRRSVAAQFILHDYLRDLLAENNAQGVAVDCLRLFYGVRMPAYPCLRFCRLNDDRFVGACEADLQSAIIVLATPYLTRRPGYISDPVIDTSKNQIIYAHCVAPTRVFGPRGTMNPYRLRSHSEDRRGASMLSLLPVGHVVTSLKSIPARKGGDAHPENDRESGRRQSLPNKVGSRYSECPKRCSKAGPTAGIAQWHRANTGGDVGTGQMIADARGLGRNGSF